MMPKMTAQSGTRYLTRLKKTGPADLITLIRKIFPIAVGIIASVVTAVKVGGSIPDGNPSNFNAHMTTTIAPMESDAAATPIRSIGGSILRRIELVA